MDSQYVLLDVCGVGSRFAVLFFDPVKNEIGAASMVDKGHNIPLRVAVEPTPVIAFKDDDVLYIKSVKSSPPNLRGLHPLLNAGTASLTDQDVVVVPSRDGGGPRVSVGRSVLPSASMNWIALYRMLQVFGSRGVLYAYADYHTHPLIYWVATP